MVNIERGKVWWEFCAVHFWNTHFGSLARCAGCCDTSAGVVSQRIEHVAGGILARIDFNGNPIAISQSVRRQTVTFWHFNQRLQRGHHAENICQHFRTTSIKWISTVDMEMVGFCGSRIVLTSLFLAQRQESPVIHSDIVHWHPAKIHSLTRHKHIHVKLIEIHRE